MEEAIEITNALEDFGLTKTEVAVYLTLLKKNQSTAYRISKESQIYKANTYMAIESLVKKNLIIKEVINQKQFFKAVPPEKFIMNSN